MNGIIKDVKGFLERPTPSMTTIRPRSDQYSCGEIMVGCVQPCVHVDVDVRPCFHFEVDAGRAVLGAARYEALRRTCTVVPSLRLWEYMVHS
jgi:hypothetical protein